MKPAVAFWSGGKDSALTVDRIRQMADFSIVALISTINRTYGRLSMHGVREELVEQQAQSIGIPLYKMYVSTGTNDEYIAELRKALEIYKQQGIEHVIFGDIFLEDLRQWREALLRDLDMTGVFPLWEENTRMLTHDFSGRGFKAIACCVSDRHLDKSYVGKSLDEAFFTSLPANVDPCGENGEYHSFVTDGPIFSHPVAYEVGERVCREGFWFVDLVPKNAAIMPA